MSDPTADGSVEFAADEVRHLAALARLGMTDAEVEKFREELASILGHCQVLAGIDTAEVEPTANGADLLNVVAEDVSRPSLAVEDVMRNAPDREENYFRVRAVLE